MEALEDFKIFSKDCFKDMEDQRKEMYIVAKKLFMLRDAIKKLYAEDKNYNKKSDINSSYPAPAPIVNS
jgi:hypothetical protein